MARVLRIVPDKRAAAEAAAERLLQSVRSSGHIALAGGSTPRDAYAIAAAAEPELDWSGATLWFSDERCVPPDHQDSNYGMVRSSLIDRLPEHVRPRVQRIRGEDGPEAAAASYEAEIRSCWKHRTPRFDLVLLGMGPDAHTASLFPTKPEIHESERLVAPVPEAGMAPQVPRVTFTFPLINQAREALFLISGKDKAQAVERSFGPLPDVTPAGLVEARRVTVVLDDAAAALLPAEVRS